MVSPKRMGAANLHSALALGHPTSSPGLVLIRSTPAAAKKSRSAVSIYLKKFEKCTRPAISVSENSIFRVEVCSHTMVIGMSDYGLNAN